MNVDNRRSRGTGCGRFMRKPEGETKDKEKHIEESLGMKFIDGCHKLNNECWHDGVLEVF